MAEIWKSVPGFEETLIVSSIGRMARITGFEYNGYKGVSVPRGSGYHPVLTTTHLKTKKSTKDTMVISVHRTVALVFNGAPADPKMDVNHRDGNKKNNLPSNLEWATRKENLAHARRFGLSNQYRTYSIAQADQARVLYAHGHTLKVIVGRTKMSEGAASYAIYGSRYKRSN